MTELFSRSFGELYSNTVTLQRSCSFLEDEAPCQMSANNRSDEDGDSEICHRQIPHFLRRDFASSTPFLLFTMAELYVGAYFQCGWPPSYADFLLYASLFTRPQLAWATSNTILHLQIHSYLVFLLMDCVFKAPNALTPPHLYFQRF